MSDFLDQVDVISIAFLVVLLVAQSASFIFWIKFELKQLRKDSEMADKNIEEKREHNVEALKVIYDLKIRDSRAYAKGLFEVNASDHLAIKEKMVGIEKTLQQILDILMKPNR